MPNPPKGWPFLISWEGQPTANFLFCSWLLQHEDRFEGLSSEFYELVGLPSPKTASGAFAMLEKAGIIDRVLEHGSGKHPWKLLLELHREKFEQDAIDAMMQYPFKDAIPFDDLHDLHDLPDLPDLPTIDMSYLSVEVVGEVEPIIPTAHVTISPSAEDVANAILNRVADILTQGENLSPAAAEMELLKVKQSLEDAQMRLSDVLTQNEKYRRENGRLGDEIASQRKVIDKNQREIIALRGNLEAAQRAVRESREVGENRYIASFERFISGKPEASKGRNEVDD